MAIVARKRRRTTTLNIKEAPSQAADPPNTRKRPQDPLHPVYSSSETPRKRARRTPRHPVVGTSVGKEEWATNKVGGGEVEPIRHWARTQHWPKGYAKQSDSNMNHLLARRKSSSSLRRKRSELAIEPASIAPSSTTPSDQKPREVKSAPYQDARYETLLTTKGSFMGRYVGENEEGITSECRSLCRTLLATANNVPADSIFDDEFFDDACEMIQDRNEAKIIQDISRLIVPSAQSLAIRGAKHLKCLVESVNEGWNNSIPLTSVRPQPDYSLGFKREAFTQGQLDILSPFIGDFISGDQSHFMATYYMYFPFLTCEVKCGAAALDIADRQNAHSMTLAVRAIVELFRLVGRDMELHREILAFSISHDHSSVRIYGHYAAIEEKKTTYYRHPIRKFDFTELNGQERWTAYKFAKNVYDIWMPTHFKRICSAIDMIPADLDFSVPQLPKSIGLSQDLDRQHLSESTEQDQPSQLSIDDAGGTTPNTSFTGGQRAPKRSRKRRTADE